MTAVDLHAEKLDAAKKLGADVAISAEAAGLWFKESKNKVDVVLVCATSAEAYQAAFHSVKRSGAMLVVGIPSKPLSWMAGDLIRSGLRIIPSRVASRAELRELVALAAAGAIHSEIHTHSLDDINSIMTRLDAGNIVGRAVITF